MVIDPLEGDPGLSMVYNELSANAFSTQEIAAAYLTN